MPPLLLIALSLALYGALPAASCGSGGSDTEERDPHPHKATSHHSFENVEKWIALFDAPDRDGWQKPEETVRALGLSAGARVADIGAGTGYFNRHLARAVGDSGRVYATDTEPEMVEHMARRAEREKTPQVRAILAKPDDPKLPEEGVDLVFIVDTYHHIDDRVRYLRRLTRRLTPQGRVAIVDFEKRPLPVGPPLEHKLARQEVVAELTEAGFRLVEEPNLLPHQYFLIFAPVR